MKNYMFPLVLALLLVSCNQQPKDYVTLKGKIDNKKDSLLYVNSQSYQKKIKVNDDGTFKDTLKVNEDFFILTNGMARTVSKLKNGFDLTVNFDADSIHETIEFSGAGSDVNNYMAKKIRLQKSFGLENLQPLFGKDKADFDGIIADMKQKMDKLLEGEEAKGLDSTFRNREIEDNKRLIDYLTVNYDQQHAVLAAMAKGQPSPDFKYEEVNGKMVSLNDLKGKYVYVDVWATWCKPCLNEIPYLKELEATYKDKNIRFVSLSIDKPEVKDQWKKMIKDKDMGGIQLFEGQNGASDFIRVFNIATIPRFLMLAPDGTIVSNDAPRPSDPALKELFNKLNI